MEIDVDGVAQKGELKAYAISEHVEKGGTHSGDATLLLPAQNISKEVEARIIEDSGKIAAALNISGPFNTQFLVKDDFVGVIETNLRASRSVPFVSKTYDVPFVRLATEIMADVDTPVPFASRCLDPVEHVAVKSPQFSFKRLLGADPILGVEMSSTGEVACFGATKEEAFLKSVLAAGFRIPAAGGVVYFAMPEGADQKYIEVAKAFEAQGFQIMPASVSTAEELAAGGVTMLETMDRAEWRASDNHAGALEPVKAGGIELVVDLTKHESLYDLRRASVDFSVPLITDVEQATLLAAALEDKPNLTITPHNEYFDQKEYYANAKPKPRPKQTVSPLAHDATALPGI